METLTGKTIEQMTQEHKEEKKEHPYVSRNDYLKSLEQDEHGYPIVDRQKFWKLACLHGWEEDFLQDAVSAGMVEAEGIPEYYQITEEYGF